MVPVDNLAARLTLLRASAPYRAYQDVRERVLRMKELETAVDCSDLATPSAYWREELANFDYMLDASPLIVDRLRQHCSHITGIRVYDYRTGRDEARGMFESKLRALLKVGGPELLIPESPLLGGFGFEIDGALYNIDTLKFYEALIALQQGAVLNDLRVARDRRVVWEIGAGWGGFAYQLKSLCPNVTYVITDFPELFLFSAVYLMAAFPDARVRFWGDEPPEKLFEGWQELDFIFVPNTFLEATRLERLDLTVNMVSFQEMTDDQVLAYVRHAYALNCPYLYSLNRDRSPYNLEQSGVPALIERFYWLHEIPMLAVGYQQMLDKAPGREPRAKDGAKRDLLDKALGWKRTRAVAKRELEYKHIVGWRRVSV